MKEYITLRGYNSDLKVEKEDNDNFTFTIIDDYGRINTVLTLSQIFALINWLNEQREEMNKKTSAEVCQEKGHLYFHLDIPFFRSQGCCRCQRCKEYISEKQEKTLQVKIMARKQP